jgi:hypothetical protein
MGESHRFIISHRTPTMTPTSTNSSGVLLISGSRAFSETAAVLGQIFEVVFEPAEQDAAGRPRSWLARRGGLRYILGLVAGPEPGSPGTPGETFGLSVTSTNGASGEKALEIADYLATRIRRDGRLNCRARYREGMTAK